MDKFKRTAPQIYDFLFAMSVCHSVVPERGDNENTVSYQASSPDENALVNGAASQGFVFYKRTPESISVYAVSRLISLLDFLLHSERIKH